MHPTNTRTLSRFQIDCVVRYWYLMNGFVNLGLAWPFVLAAPVVSLLSVGRPFTAKKMWNLVCGLRRLMNITYPFHIYR